MAAKRLFMYRRVHVPGFAFTVLQCFVCKWRVWLEAHHTLSGRVRGHREKDYVRRRAKLNARGLSCPKCKSEAWRYVRTEVRNAVLYDRVTLSK